MFSFAVPIVCVCVCSECLFFFERRLVQSNNASAFVVTVPDENQCKPASLIAACCLGCCPFVTSIVCVFMSSLTAGLPWYSSLWGGGIVSALTWGQLVTASDYLSMRIMRALHAAVRRVFAASPWCQRTLHAPCMP